MKKLFFFAALMTGASLMAQPAYQWNELLTGNEKSKVQSSINEIRYNAQGEAFIGGSYGSLNKDARATLSTDQETFMGYTYESHAYYVGNSYHKNFMLVKLGADETPLWTVYSVKGEYTNGNAQTDLYPTKDGGAVVFMTMRYAEGDAALAKAGEGTTEYPLAWIVDAKKDTTKFNLTSTQRSYQTVIARFDKDGQLTAAKLLKADDATYTNALSVETIVEDKDGYIYIAGNQGVDLTYDEHTIATTATGFSGSLTNVNNSFILKVDAALAYSNHITTSGTANFMIIRDMEYANDALYLYGTTGKTADATATLADKTITLQNELNFFTAKLNTNLASAQYLTRTTTVKYNTANNFMYYGMTMAQDGKSFYFTGGMVGAIMLKDDTVKAVGTKSGSYNGVVLQFDAQNGQLMNYYMREDATTAPLDGNYYGWTVAQWGDSLYIPRWKLGKQYLDRFDKDLHYVETTDVAEAGTTTSVCYAADSYNDRLLIGLRARNNGAFSVAGTDVDALNQSAWFGVLAAYRLPEQHTALDIVPEDQTARKVMLSNGQVAIRRGNLLYDLLGNPIQ